VGTRSRFDVPLDIGRFTALNVRSPQLRLIEAMPPLKPAAEAVVRAMIRAYGNELFGRGNANSGPACLDKGQACTAKHQGRNCVVAT
jgi:hypothetical protein